VRSRRDVASAALGSALIAAVALAACSSPDAAQPGPVNATSADAGVVADASALAERACPSSSVATYENFGAPFFFSYCTGCHSSALGEGQRRNAPIGVNFDSLDDIRRMRERIWARAADKNTTMPPVGGPSDAQRELLGDWLACGAPGDDVQLDAGPIEIHVDPPPTGACADLHAAVPPASLPRCTAATLACILGCAGKPNNDACNNACLTADATPADKTTGLNCIGCYQTQLLSCVERNGCHDSLARALCCQAEKCPAGSTPDCNGTKCSGEFSAVGLCVGYRAPDCFNPGGGDLGACFAKPADAGGGG